MDVSRADFLGQYKLISNKLKKKFLRKPNVAEASEEFVALAKELENQECPHYAAFCCLAVARCEHTLGNYVGETRSLIKAAQLFLETEEQNHKLLCPGFDENLNAALSCYSHAIKVYLDNNKVSLAASLCLEVGQCLRLLGRTAQAIPHFRKAADLQCSCPLSYLNSLDHVATCKIETGDFNGALNVFTEMYSLAKERGGATNNKSLGFYTSILSKCEVTSVLLLLLLQPPPQKLKTEHAHLLERYAWESSEDDSSVSVLGEDLFLLLQSTVMACQSRDLGALKSLRNDLWPLLSPEQNHLLHELVHRMTESIG